jgi:hypothetical protein
MVAAEFEGLGARGNGPQKEPRGSPAWGGLVEI